MQPTDSEPPLPPSSIVEPPGGPGTSEVVAVRPARLWPLALGAGIVAGLASWLGGELSLSAIQPPRHEVRSRGRTVRVASRHDQALADVRNAALAFGLVGTALGTGLGVAGGLARRSGRAAAAAGLLGLVAGAAAGAGMSLALLPRYAAFVQRNPDQASHDLLYPLVIHAGIWSAVGAAGGLALGLGLGATSALPRIVGGALGGGALGAVAYELIGALAFPLAKTTQLVAETWEARLLARLAVTVLATAGAALAAGAAKSRSRHDSPTA